jgi:hypothetical protein
MLTLVFRLVTLQSCILDNKESLSDVVREIDKIVNSDVSSVLVCFSFHLLLYHPLGWVADFLFYFCFFPPSF